MCLQMKVLKILAGELAFMAVVVSVVLTVGHSHEKRSLMVGILCVIFGTCMYASPLTVMVRSHFLPSRCTNPMLTLVGFHLKLFRKLCFNYILIYRKW